MCVAIITNDMRVSAKWEKKLPFFHTSFLNDLKYADEEMKDFVIGFQNIRHR